MDDRLKHVPQKAFGDWKIYWDNHSLLCENIATINTSGHKGHMILPLSYTFRDIAQTHFAFGLVPSIFDGVENQAACVIMMGEKSTQSLDVIPTIIDEIDIPINLHMKPKVSSFAPKTIRFRFIFIGNQNISAASICVGKIDHTIPPGAKMAQISITYSGDKKLCLGNVNTTFFRTGYHNSYICYLQSPKPLTAYRLLRSKFHAEQPLHEDMLGGFCIDQIDHAGTLYRIKVKLCGTDSTMVNGNILLGLLDAETPIMLGATHKIVRLPPGGRCFTITHENKTTLPPHQSTPYKCHAHFYTTDNKPAVFLILGLNSTSSVAVSPSLWVEDGHGDLMLHNVTNKVTPINETDILGACVLIRSHAQPALLSQLSCRPCPFFFDSENTVAVFESLFVTTNCGLQFVNYPARPIHHDQPRPMDH
ncbi:hypothetical protein RHVP.10 [Cricetid gammaherpesvirus 2]|uniref:Uncharacterized protein n=1 Tax=Cricetid gammaherpesvirus 2 TaxID=1605972 RepID=E9M5J7_9GAMA|nr:hypothetical protein RHVP.10 [Cricetid gammaherpesvirus 2]ADW24355.1 hypothetical protein RHVP.10 [Cricetid gammaherpesvirus 2]ADW24437.1 hypothetical protein RHVP-L.10 [Cricetid gammaherpesvirus 2]